MMLMLSGTQLTDARLYTLLIVMGQVLGSAVALVECLTRDRRDAGSSLTGIPALWSLSETHLS